MPCRRSTGYPTAAAIGRGRATRRPTLDTARKYPGDLDHATVEAPNRPHKIHKMGIARVYTRNGYNFAIEDARTAPPQSAPAALGCRLAPPPDFVLFSVPIATPKITILRDLTIFGSSEAVSRVCVCS